MNIENGLDAISFQLLRREIALVYDLYFDYVTKKKSEGCFQVPDTFMLTAAFSCVFSEVTLQSGYVFFSVENKNTVITSKVKHYWLTFLDESRVIDVVPVDGAFGISTPQAVIQSKNRTRFVPCGELYPRNWSREDKVAFDTSLSDVVSVLGNLRSMIHQ